MIKKEDVNYELEVQENYTASFLAESYRNKIMIWLTASGNGKYRYILQYNEYIEYHEGEKLNATANQVFLHGAIDAVNRINKPSVVCIIAPTALGFEGAFKGKGANCSLVQELLEIIASKKCSLIEVRCDDATPIKQYISDNSGNGDYVKYLKEQKLKKENYRKTYKEKICDELKEKIITVLKDNNVDEEVINKIRSIK